jgi:integrase
VRGHIEHRGPDCWRIAIDLGTDATGKRRRISHTVHGSRKQAEAERNRLLHELGCGEYVAPSQLTVGEYLTQWLAHAKASVAPQTYRRYKQIVENDLTPDLGRIRLADLTPLDIQGFLARSSGRKCKNRDRDLSARTVLHYHRLLRRALHQAVRWQLIPRNPCDLVDSPRVTPVEMRALDEDGLVALLGAVRGTRLSLPALLAAVTGMRRGELLALRWSDVDLETGECRVVRSLQETPDGPSFKAPKTNKGRRVVLLPRLALAALKAHRAIQNEGKLLLGPGYQDQDLILARADGSPWPPSQFSSEFARLVKRKGFAVRFHDLRHTHASQLLRQGVPVKVVSERLGHSTTSVTMDVYAHSLPGMQAEAVAKIDAAFGKAVGE